MNTRYRHINGHFSSLIDALERFHDTGIDPAFDSEMEDLEREFASLRLTFGHD